MRRFRQDFWAMAAVFWAWLSGFAMALGDGHIAITTGILAGVCILSVLVDGVE